MSPLAPKLFIDGGSWAIASQKVPLERPSGQAADDRRLGRKLGNLGDLIRARLRHCGPRPTCKRYSCPTSEPEGLPACSAHQPGQRAILAVARGARPRHQDRVDLAFMPFGPLFHRARPGGGRGGCLAITPAHQSLTRYCFAPDHAAAHLNAQANLGGGATNYRRRLEITMKTLLPIAAIAALMLGGAEAAIAAKLPTFERDGFPITPHQLQLLGPHGVQEQTPTLSFVVHAGWYAGDISSADGVETG